MSDDRSLIACSRMWVDVDDDDDACCVENVLDNEFSVDESVEDGIGNAPSPLSKRACRTAESFEVSLRLTLGEAIVAAEAISTVSSLIISLLFLLKLIGLRQYDFFCA